MLFVWRGSVLPKILPRLLLLLLLTLLICYFKTELITYKATLNPIAFTFFGIALALFLGFRNSASYDRFWEGRKLWGALVIDSRSLARQALTLTSYDAKSAETKQFIKYLIAFPYALMRQLRSEDSVPDLHRILGNPVNPEIQNASFKPVMLMKAMGSWVQQARSEAKIDSILQAQFDNSINKLSDITGGCERISNTPIPYSYSVLLHRTIYIYCFLLPLGLVETMDWFMPVVVMFIAYTFVALEAIADELEDPFGKEPNDLALNAICNTIEHSLLELSNQEYQAPPKSDQYFII